MALCNMTTEIGAKTAYIQPDAITLDYCDGRVKHDSGIVTTDAGYAYAAEHTYDVSPLKPQLAAPHSVDNVLPSSKLIGTPIHQAFLGTCTGGRAEDLAVAAKILKGKKVHRRNPFHRRPGFQRRSPPGDGARGTCRPWWRPERTFVTPAVRGLSGDP